MRYLLFSVLTLLFVSSCINDGNSVDAMVTLEGQWELKRALRNNMETELLDGLVMNFQPDGKLETNLMGNEAPGTYTWEGDEIVTEGVKLPLTYTIKEMTDSTLNLRSRYQSYQFDFEMVR